MSCPDQCGCVPCRVSISTERNQRCSKKKKCPGQHWCHVVFRLVLDKIISAFFKEKITLNKTNANARHSQIISNSRTWESKTRVFLLSILLCKIALETVNRDWNCRMADHNGDASDDQGAQALCLLQNRPQNHSRRTDYPHVDTPASRYKSVNFGAEKGPACVAQKDRDRACQSLSSQLAPPHTLHPAPFTPQPTPYTVQHKPAEAATW